MRSPGRAPKNVRRDPFATRQPTVSRSSLIAPISAPRPGERITRARRPRPSALSSPLLPVLPDHGGPRAGCYLQLAALYAVLLLRPDQLPEHTGGTTPVTGPTLFVC